MDLSDPFAHPIAKRAISVIAIQAIVIAVTTVAANTANTANTATAAAATILGISTKFSKMLLLLLNFTSASLGREF